MAFCSESDITDRLSATGLLYSVDDDNDGVLDASESAVVASVIADIDADIEMYLTPIFNDISSLAGNVWLKVRAVDMVCHRLLERKGQTPPESLIAANTRAYELLELVRTRKVRIPRAAYPGDGFIEENRAIGLPHVSNPRPRR